MSHDPKELRETAEQHDRIAATSVDWRRTEAQVEAKRLRYFADLIERHAKLLKHAEAMCEWIDRVLSCVERAEQDIGGETMGAIIPDGGPIFDSYRADFPKED